MISKSITFVVFISFSSLLLSQKDSSAYTLFNKQWIIYSDLGYTSAPFSISYPYSTSISKIQYKNNYRTVLGLGVSYKWFALRLGIPLPGYTRPVNKYGETSPFNIGFDFSFKKFYCDFDIRYFKGYAIKDAFQWDDSLNATQPNDIQPSMQASSFSSNVWYFHHKDFKMSALKGKTGHYNSKVHTWYVKNTFNIFGVSNDKNTLIPESLVTTSKDKTEAGYLSALDIGVVPGYAYVDKIKNWQFAVMGGLGGVIQAKFYGGNVPARGFIGLAPRYDIRLLGGYTVPNYFVFLVTDFDNKSIRFGDLIYRQHFYAIKLVAGKRFPLHTNKKSAKQ